MPEARPEGRGGSYDVSTGLTGGPTKGVDERLAIDPHLLDNYVIGPASAVDGDFALFDGVTGKKIKDGPLAPSTDGTMGSNSDAKIPTEKAVVTYVAAHSGTGNVVGPGSATNNDFAQFDGTTGKLIKDGGFSSASFDAAGAAAAALVSAEAYADAGDATRQPLDGDLTAIAALSTTGFPARTTTNTWALRTWQPPAAGITITNPAGVAGDPTLVLANDLAGLEGLSGTGFAARTAADTWAVRTLQQGTGISITNPAGVAGDPTIAVTGVLPSAGAFHPGYTSGNYYGPPRAQESNAAAGNNTLHAVPFYVGVAQTFTKASVQVTSGGTAATEVTIGLYANSNGAPGALLQTFGHLPTTGTGVQELTGLTIALTPGWYFLAVVGNNINPILAGGSGTVTILDFLLGTTSPNSMGSGYTGTFTYSSGSLPNPFPSPVLGSNANQPYVFLRF